MLAMLADIGSGNFRESELCASRGPFCRMAASFWRAMDDDFRRNESASHEAPWNDAPRSGSVRPTAVDAAVEPRKTHI
jgi:hypothetical protein